MNFNLIILRLKIMFYLLLGKIRKNSFKIKLPNRNKIKQVVIFFPIDEDSFRLALYSFRNFDFNENNIRYYFVINEKFRNIINLNKFNLIFVNYRKDKMQFCKNRDKILKRLKDKNIGVSVHYSKPLPKMTYYKKKYKLILENYKNASLYGSTNISLPIYPKLLNVEIDLICKTGTEITEDCVFLTFEI